MNNSDRVIIKRIPTCKPFLGWPFPSRDQTIHEVEMSSLPTQTVHPLKLNREATIKIHVYILLIMVRWGVITQKLHLYFSIQAIFD